MVCKAHGTVGREPNYLGINNIWPLSPSKRWILVGSLSASEEYGGELVDSPFESLLVSGQVKAAHIIGSSFWTFHHSAVFYENIFSFNSDISFECLASAHQSHSLIYFHHVGQLKVTSPRMTCSVPNCKLPCLREFTLTAFTWNTSQITHPS